MPALDRFRNVRSALRAGADQRAALVGRLGRAWQIITPLGRTVMAVGALAWIGGWWLGWRELMVLAGACLVLLVTSVLFVVGRAALDVDVELNPSRVVTGEPSAGQIRATNRSSRPTPPLQVELPVGAGLAVFDLPAVAAGSVVDELFVVPTERRGVIRVGPATSVRADPLGLFQRRTSGQAARELIVHPQTVALQPFGSGLLRDLEGLTTQDLSLSDLAFHSLREYTPGDDRRHVHWRSSAKAGRLLVRQFLDTRRSTLCAVVDGRSSGYGDPSEFETALQVAGSVARRACRDELPGVVVAGGGPGATGVVAHILLDVLARAQLDSSGPDLAALAGRAVTRGVDVSFAVLVSGSQSSAMDLQRAAVRFPPAVRVLAIRVVPGELPGVRAGGRATVVQLGDLAQLPALLRQEVVS